MDINDLKVNEAVLLLQNEVIEEIREFKGLNEQIAGITTPLIIKKIEELKSGFTKFFEENGFDVTLSPSRNSQKASNGNFTITLNDMEVLGQGFDFGIQEKNIIKK